mmetsp:Transcript_15746/g.34231  ORF Transcript_15746/g.34231 Transcript_15746/m.34231 type:complete len:209 (+) Transcript_15746:871-1497(+)
MGPLTSGTRSTSSAGWAPCSAWSKVFFSRPGSSQRRAKRSTKTRSSRSCSSRAGSTWRPRIWSSPPRAESTLTPSSISTALCATRTATWRSPSSSTRSRKPRRRRARRPKTTTTRSGRSTSPTPALRSSCPLPPTEKSQRKAETSIPPGTTTSQTSMVKARTICPTRSWRPQPRASTRSSIGKSLPSEQRMSFWEGPRRALLSRFTRR